MKQLIRECLRDYVDQLDRVDITGEKGESRFNPAENCALENLSDWTGGFKLLIKYWETVLTDAQYYQLSVPFMSLRIQQNVTFNFAVGPWLRALALESDLIRKTADDRLFLVHLTLVSSTEYFAVWWSMRDSGFIKTTHRNEPIPPYHLREYAAVMHDLSKQSRFTEEDQQLRWDTLIAELDLLDAVDYNTLEGRGIPKPIPRKIKMGS